jgi:CubicO group peptidase (beta-lactamase class C family)
MSHKPRGLARSGRRDRRQKDDSLVFAKGYGVQAGTHIAPRHTPRFAIGSTTKAMTSAGPAMLVDEGNPLDDRVTKYIPELQLYDPWSLASGLFAIC